ncbi:amino acid adenylation domain-containing protein [Streptomyces sp. NPDC021093]|uniref:amino acid adenylation domain-containing protein n=1 Tax=Streptomyces sp. NPDC021093 TaxID=3365112 RepID=UPI00379903BF
MLHDDIAGRTGKGTDPGEPFPLTPMQQAYWMGRHQGQVLGGAGCHDYFEVDCADIDPERLRIAIRGLIARQGMLRMRVLDDGRQQILETSPWPGLTVHDLRARPREEAEEELLRLRERLADHRLDPDAGLVFDIQLSLVGADFSRIHFLTDLVAVDGHSILILLADLGRNYADPSRPLPPLDYGFPQYLADASAEFAQDRADAIRYWRRVLPDLPGRPALPLARQPETVTTPTIRHIENTISPDEWSRLCDNARAHGVTPATALATAYAETLGFWSAEPRFLVNFPVFNRKMINPAVPQLIGDFTNLVLVPVDVSTPMPFADRARVVHDSFLDNLEHCDFYGVEVLRELIAARADTANHAPAVFTYLMGDGRTTDPEGRQRLGKMVYTTGRTPQLWIDCQAVLLEGELTLSWEAIDELFPPGVIEDMAHAQSQLVRRLATAEAWSQPAHLNVPRDQLPARAAVNATTAPASNSLLHSGFFDHARQHPGRVALVWGEDGHLTYGQLADTALRVAAALLRHGVRRQEPVALSLPRGPEQIATVLGILAAGACYVPLTAQPVARLRLMARSAGVRCLITDSRDAEGIDAEPLVYADLLSTPPLARPVPGTPRDLAYTIFTSGSTGEPKGVELPHAAAVNTIDSVNRRFDVCRDDRALAVSSLDFDLSVYDVFGLLSVGGSLVLLDEGQRLDPEAWVALASSHRVTLWNSVPAILDMLLTTVGPDRSLPDLRLALASGDWIDPELPGRLAAATENRCRFIALGGPTETAVWSNVFEVVDQPDDWPSIPYGFPLPNQRHRVVDRLERDRPDWVPGELWVGGLCLADGYRGDPALTASRFVERSGERWYRTGDLVRYRPGGILEFLGRLDHQVEIGGFRVEPGEIEHVLTEHPAVHKAVVVAPAIGKQRSLRGFVQLRDPAPGQGPDAYDLGEVELDPLERLRFKASRHGLREVDGRAFPLLDALEPIGRRSCRRYSSAPVTRSALSHLLSALRSTEATDCALPRYRYASAGALYPVQVYLHARPGRIQGLDAGAYYYDPRGHRLVRTAERDGLPDDLFPASNRALAAHSAFTLFLVAQRRAVDPLYGRVARDFCLLEAGLITQLLETTAAQTGLGMCQVGADAAHPALRETFALDDGHELLHTAVGGVPEAEQEDRERADPQQTIAELRRMLAAKLPQHMIPASLVAVDSLPLTARGKVDRTALLRRAAAPAAERNYREPGNDIERTILEVVRQVLDLEQVDPDGHFLQIGANSVELTRIFTVLRDRLPQHDFRLLSLFEHSTPHDLADWLAGGAEPEADAAEEGRARARRQQDQRAAARARRKRG